MRVLMPAILDGYQRRKDRTVSLRFITQEKTSSEVMQIDEALHQFGVLYFRGEENMNSDEVEELDKVELDKGYAMSFSYYANKRERRGTSKPSTSRRQKRLYSTSKIN